MTARAEATAGTEVAETEVAETEVAETEVAGIEVGVPLDTGRGWFPRDADRHRVDAPRFCPACATPWAMDAGGRGITTEYWMARDRVFVCYCGACGWSGDIVLAERVIGHEPEH